MSNYPMSIPDVRAAVQSYGTPPADVADLYFDILTKASPVDQVVGAFDLLKDRIDVLDGDGLAVLAGVSELVMRHNWHGKQDEALTIRDRVIPLLPEVRPAASADP